MSWLVNKILAAFGLCRVVGWMNIYKSGYYHRAGKPGMFDRHPGDLYPTRKSAMDDVDRNAAHLYVATTRVVWYEPKRPHVNCVNSVPVPVIESRRKLAAQPDGGYVDGVWQDPADVELEKAERESWLVLAAVVLMGIEGVLWLTR